MQGIVLAGINHKCAPVEVRERLAFGHEALAHALPLLRAAVGVGCDRAVEPEAAILSTCNRTEIYLHTPAPADAESAILRFLAERSGVPACELAGLLYYQVGEHAVDHLLRVACGLDSLLVGENEILGQVKDAGESAQAAGTMGPVLNSLFRTAAEAGKSARRDTEIGRAPLSFAALVVELAQERLGSLEQRAALLVGAGKMSSLTGRALVRAGLRCVLVANRTYDRAERLARALCGTAVHFDALPASLLEADLIVCSTGAPHFVLRYEDVAHAMELRGGRPLLVVDLAVPRDADPAIAALPGVQLVDVDDLTGWVQRRDPLAAQTLDDVETIVAQASAEFAAWLAARQAVPVIQALRLHVEGICSAEADRALQRMGELTPEQRDAVAAMAHAIAAKLLHRPVVNLKSPPEGMSHGEIAYFTQELFGLE